MPGLQKIELRFRMVEGVYGLENLKKLQQVLLAVSSQAPKDVREKVTQIKESSVWLSMSTTNHQNRSRLFSLSSLCFTLILICGGAYVVYFYRQ